MGGADRETGPGGQPVWLSEGMGLGPGVGEQVGGLGQRVRMGGGMMIQGLRGPVGGRGGQGV